ncbi:MAG TPA: metal ABC transporter permease [Alphaproteobacteria bacterium]|nr:metal ABC transporter permease [Alphaproteobacteria bacterium]
MLERLWSILSLQAGYNTTVVLAGTTLLGVGAAVIGSFVLLRKRALVSDAISHATLPGIALGFLVAYAAGLDGGRNLPILLLGAAATGALGVFAVQWIRDHTRLPEDTAIGTVLSVFFGAGMVLLSHIQTLPGGSRAGLGSFLLGQTAALSQSEAWLIGLSASVVILLSLLFFKEFAVLCFDPGFARAQGWPVRGLDLLMMGLLLATVSIGLKTVGLVLIVALLIIPPAAARFWTHRLAGMVLVAGIFGGAAGYLGAALSALFPRLPAGGIIVLAAGGLFAVSLLVAPRRGIVAGGFRQLAFRLAAIERHALLTLAAGGRPAGLGGVLLRLRGQVDGSGRVTARGTVAMRVAARNQALWLRYLEDFPQDALAREDWGRAPIDRALPRDLVAELERRAGATG